MLTAFQYCLLVCTHSTGTFAVTAVPLCWVSTILLLPFKRCASMDVFVSILGGSLLHLLASMGELVVMREGYHTCRSSPAEGAVFGHNTRGGLCNVCLHPCVVRLSVFFTPRGHA